MTSPELSREAGRAMSTRAFRMRYQTAEGRAEFRRTIEEADTRADLPAEIQQLLDDCAKEIQAAAQ